MIALVTGACTGGSVDEGSAAEDVIVGARGDPAATIPKVNRLAVNDPDALRSAAMAHIEDTNSQVRTAALYALSVSVVGEDEPAVEALRGFLDVENELDRLTAAGGLLSIGEKAALPVLIELLGSDLPLPFSDPPTEVWEVARGMLLFHADQDLGLEAAEDVGGAQAAQEAWRAWWGSSGEGLAWDADALRFSA